MAQFATFDGESLHYEVEGEGSPVVLLHGLSSSVKGNWRDPGIWDALVAGGHRVVGLDARGHGQSAKPHDPAAYEHDAMVKDTLALLDHLSLARVDLAGYSMGAVTALRFATQRADRLTRLVLGGIGGDPTIWGTDRDPRRGTAQRWLAGLEAKDPSQIEDKVARAARKVFEARGNDLQAIAALLRANRSHLSADMGLNHVSVPTLVICGDQDANPVPLAAALPDGRSEVVDGDHESVVPNPALAKAIVEFFAA